jgi:hypothetical protein
MRLLCGYLRSRAATFRRRERRDIAAARVWLDDSGRWRRGTMPPIRAALAISLLAHAAAFWWALPQLHLPSLEQSTNERALGSLQVRLAPPPSLAAVEQSAGGSRALVARAAPSPRTRALAPLDERPVRAEQRKAPPAPAVVAAPPSQAPAATAPPAAHAPPASSTGDFSSFVEARRRARGETVASAAEAASQTSPGPAADSDAARTSRIVAGNLGTERRKTFGFDPAFGGGMFQITRLTDNSAEFIFLGWDREIRRTTKQYIEVRRAGTADIRTAVVRRMVGIIRDHESGDFLWESIRLGRYITLSARPRDNAELERFLMKEFFPDVSSPG